MGNVTDRLRLDAGYSSIDGEIDANDLRPYVAGNDVPNAPEFTSNIALTWDQDIGGLNLLARFEYAYQGDVFYLVVQGNDLDTIRVFQDDALPPTCCSAVATRELRPNQWS